jgi:hypothetical protein
MTNHLVFMTTPFAFYHWLRALRHACGGDEPGALDEENPYALSGLIQLWIRRC